MLFQPVTVTFTETITYPSNEFGQSEKLRALGARVSHCGEKGGVQVIDLLSKSWVLEPSGYHQFWHIRYPNSEWTALSSNNTSDQGCAP